MCVLAGVALSLGTILIDRKYDYKLVPTFLSGGPDAALEILGTVAASMVSLAALVLTITMVVVQLAMGQFSKIFWPKHLGNAGSRCEDSCSYWSAARRTH